MTAKPLNVFLDTDIGPDCDDTAALAILLQRCREGRAKAEDPNVDLLW